MRNLIGLALLPLAAAVPHASHNSYSTYDYVIVGGGTSGLVVANRLSEQKDTTVLVIEAGGSVYDNPNVTDTLGYSKAFGTDIDWAYKTTNQEYAGGTPQTVRAGKALGGTSTINGMVYLRAQAAQIDAWETVGNKGWNWKSMLPYFKKSEKFQDPAQYPFLDGSGVAFDPAYHGFTGPLKVGWSSTQLNDGLAQKMNATYQNLEVPVQYNRDPNSGDMVGYSLYPKTVDSELNIREDAARAYYYPYQSRTNLHVWLYTHANKLTWKDGDKATADGVEVTLSNGTTTVVKATREVILAAGALKSPVLLELSGVGNPDILSKYGIATKINLPTVGENLQDQMNNGLQFDSKTTYGDKSAAYVSYPSAAQLFPNSTAVGAELLRKLPAYAAQVASANGNITKACDLSQFFKIQWDLIFKYGIPVAEILLEPTGAMYDTEYWGSVPFSRGSIHLSSADPTAAAIIDPKYFMLDFDLHAQVQAARFIREVFKTEPFADMAGAETSPGVAAIAADAGDDGWADFIKGKYRSNFHPISTAAMMPKEIGGVVDSSLKVYGTSNVRVVDASVLPFQVCGHLQSTVYAVAERAADIIKGQL
ncbi:Glucose-methanol-choline oxidoreductase [Penicillium cf. griseofulvum]|uniref:glucose oxidase n=1 Tax=Penicillium cf. griseofulvum TaxID=2972120 RepID=A0A9W9JPG9_9EURO|nr:Glucose-methanol-choline oxidoreductase [Penicillium cf. griseofulvum]KAJ5424339.1 Glucose-methanol-choline oxidoreductase [Penicillium cf. griseofulvum]KAJ5442419.1 Glucose-methanol-choline oxidoreductase [Penicillium cf. griseofulvum]